MGHPARPEVESFLSVAEQRARRRLIEAQSTDIARAMASICNDEQASYGVMSGHDRKTLSLSGLAALNTHSFAPYRNLRHRTKRPMVKRAE
jgi:hypothetical protein